jgi:hypothetical protein
LTTATEIRQPFVVAYSKALPVILRAAERSSRVGVCACAFPEDATKTAKAMIAAVILKWDMRRWYDPGFVFVKPP